MNIEGSNILVLGGWGLVGAAITKKLMQYNPNKIIVTSLREYEVKDAINTLKNQFPNEPDERFEAYWGNLFTRHNWKDENPQSVMQDEKKRKRFIKDIFSELDDEILHDSALYKLIEEKKPDLIIDCINTATAIAYLNTYKQTNKVIHEIENDSLSNESVENLIASSYIPQLIRHIQILSKAMTDFSTNMYLKIGTSGTGGMGLNIPYTHSEERPSRVLMSKTAVAGAHTLLMFLMARTPNSTIVKEIKPSATIAWKKIAYDEIKKSGQAMPLVDMNPQNGKRLENEFLFDDTSSLEDLGDTLKSVFIDTGENGIFSRGEFEAISSLGQMEIVTAEEIAEYTIFEVRGGNTGKDVIQGLDAFVLGPTYRGGYLRAEAMNKIKKLEEEHNVSSVAFELLGPPRLSKLLHEANILRIICQSFDGVLDSDIKVLTKQANDLIKENRKLRSEILSIGLPILFEDGKYIRGSVVKIPVREESNKIEVTEKNIEKWTHDGWIDLREENFNHWKKRLNQIKKDTDAIASDNTSSEFHYKKEFWDNYENLDFGKLAAWIFENEDKGWRFKR